MSFDFNEGPMAYDSSLGSAKQKAYEKCKPDYEGMIARARKEIDLCTEYLTAAAKFGSSSLHLGGELNNIVGKVFLYRETVRETMEAVIKQQEEDTN